MKNEDEIFIQIKGVGFTFLLDKRVKHNFVNPALLAFFSLGEKQMYSLLNYNIGEVNTKSEYNNSDPFTSHYYNENVSNHKATFHYVGKKVGRCRDNKFRECKVFRIEFEYEGIAYSELFFVDNTLKGAGILSSHFLYQARIK